MEVYCSERDNQEIWRAHWLKAVADIRCEKLCTVDEAEEMLRKSDIDNQIELKEVNYWVENK